MSLIGDIAAAYRHPARVAANQKARGVTEPQTLVYGLLFGFLSFVAQLPALSVMAGSTGAPLAGLAAANFAAFVFFMPLMLYLLAALAHVIVLRFGGRASWSQARRALFWAALVSTPLILLTGLAGPFLPKTMLTLAQLVTGAVFFWQWIACQHYFEFKAGHG
jgi:hypothetical protein